MRSLLLNSAELQCVCAFAYARDFVFCGRFFCYFLFLEIRGAAAGAAGVCVCFVHTHSHILCARNIVCGTVVHLLT